MVAPQPISMFELSGPKHRLNYMLKRFRFIIYCFLFQSVISHADPIDLSPSAIAARTGIYDIQGLELLTGPSTPLRAGDRIAFYGDSITWLGAYISELGNAISASPHTAPLNITLLNRGIDCAKSFDLLQGVQNFFCGGQNAPDFATQLANDTPTIIVIFVGINDVRHNLGPLFTASVPAMEGLADLAVASGARVILVSPAVSGEHPDGSNPFDTDIDIFTNFGKQIAAAREIAFLDIRKVFRAYLGNHNVVVLPDGSQSYQASGILTYDQVHPNSTGANLIANHIAYSIVLDSAYSIPTLNVFSSIGLGSIIFLTAFYSRKYFPKQIAASSARR